jgi:hypothetical protein
MFRWPSATIFIEHPDLIGLSLSEKKDLVGCLQGLEGSLYLVFVYTHLGGTHVILLQILYEFHQFVQHPYGEIDILLQVVIQRRNIFIV